MGFDLTWVNDPYEDERLEAFSAVLAARPKDADPDRWISAAYRAAEALGGYFRTSSAMMRSLVAEMEAQGMFEGNESMREKLGRNAGDVVTSEEIERALENGDLRPTTDHPQVEPTKLDGVFATFALENPAVEVVSAVENTIMLSPVTWAWTWVRWLRFMLEAHEHGGIEVA